MRHSFAGLAIASVFCAGVSMSAQGGAQPTATQSNESSRPQAGEMVISGCLKSSSSDVGPGGTIFTLEGRAAGVDSNTHAQGAAPEAATAPRGTPITPMNGTYSLSPRASVNLTEHVGQQVELTGRLQPAPAEPGAIGTAGTTGIQKPDARADIPGGAHKTFEVSSVKTLLMKCQ